MQLEALAVGINLEICVDLVEFSGIAGDKFNSSHPTLRWEELCLRGALGTT